MEQAASAIGWMLRGLEDDCGDAVCDDCKPYRRIRRAESLLRERLAHCDTCGKPLGDEGHIHTCTPVLRDAAYWHRRFLGVSHQHEGNWRQCCEHLRDAYKLALVGQAPESTKHFDLYVALRRLMETADD